MSTIDRIQGKSQKNIASGVDTNDVTYCILADYPKITTNIANIDAGEFVDGALDIITKLRDLALQIVMAIEFLPETVSIDAVASPSRGKGFGTKPEKAQLWQIRKVEIEQKRYIVKEKTDVRESESGRKSPRAHFRKWHWRRVAVGAKRKGREWRLIPNTYVNPEVEDS